jgi:hypothetical protein
MRPSFFYKTFVLALCVIGTLSAADNEKIRTDWRFYEQNLGLIAGFPLKFEAQSGSFALTYKGFGLGTTVFDLHAWDMFEDFENNHKMLAVFAPATIYYVPWASHRRAHEITPVVFNFHATLCFWGPKNTKLMDFGFGFQYYQFQLGAGFKSLKSDSRNFFVPESETGFNDYPVNNGSFYVSINITPGIWEALSSKVIKPAESKPEPDQP